MHKSAKGSEVGSPGLSADQLPRKTLHIVVTSDTHGHLEKLTVPAPPSGESVLIHCGDFESGPKLEAWLKLPPQANYKYKLVVCGNHDTTHKKLDGREQPLWDPTAASYELALNAAVRLQEDAGVTSKSVIRSAVLLHNSGCVVGGHLFWGSPYHAQDPANDSKNNRHFERTEEELKAMYALMPANTDVLATHAGPHGVLDQSNFGSKPKHLGSQSLLQQVVGMPTLKLHVFGHVHAAFSASSVPAAGPNGLGVVSAAASLRKKCGSDGLTPVDGDVRVVSNGKTVFGNAAGLRVAAGQMRFQGGKDLEPLGQGTLRTSLVFQLPAEPVGRPRIINVCK